MQWILYFLTLIPKIILLPQRFPYFFADKVNWLSFLQTNDNTLTYNKVMLHYSLFKVLHHDFQWWLLLLIETYQLQGTLLSQFWVSPKGPKIQELRKEHLIHHFYVFLWHSSRHLTQDRSSFWKLYPAWREP